MPTTKSEENISNEVESVLVVVVMERVLNLSNNLFTCPVGLGGSLLSQIRESTPLANKFAFSLISQSM